MNNQSRISRYSHIYSFKSPWCFTGNENFQSDKIKVFIPCWIFNSHILRMNYLIRNLAWNYISCLITITFKMYVEYYFWCIIFFVFTPLTHYDTYAFIIIETDYLNMIDDMPIFIRQIARHVPKKKILVTCSSSLLALYWSSLCLTEEG